MEAGAEARAGDAAAIVARIAEAWTMKPDGSGLEGLHRGDRGRGVDPRDWWITATVGVAWGVRDGLDAGWLLSAAVFTFERVEPGLAELPIAARRALDHAGRRLSLDGWRSLSVDSAGGSCIYGPSRWSTSAR